MDIKTIVMLAAAVIAADGMARTVPAELFGQNLEHTRASITGGLSAELVRNRKFAGKPSQEGIAWGWKPCGARAVYDLVNGGTFTRHARGSANVPRRNELSAQKITTLEADGFAGIRQEGLAVIKGRKYEFTARVRASFPEDELEWKARIGGAEQRFVTKGKEWRKIAFSFDATVDADVALELSVKGRATGLVGAVSLMRSDNLMGMRYDVLECLRQIGTTIIRWPGGNFAGDYRWKDGLLERDARGPLQSYIESETQAYTTGFDVNDIGTDEVLELCRYIGAKPYFTINAAWDRPEGSAEWVKYCKGKVRMWSLGNEFGYPHMEGPQDPEAYAKIARAHGEAMLKVDPELKLTTSGHYPGHTETWLKGSGEPLKDIAPLVSAHCYTRPNDTAYDYSTPERIETALTNTLGMADQTFAGMQELARRLPEGMKVSFDEWNFWYTWFREDGALHGIYAMHYIHRIMREWEALHIDVVCFFQAINEGAIRVYPRSVRLTSIGEALRLAKEHIGGEEIEGLPRELFGTEKAGARYFTAYNPSSEKPLELKVPFKGEIVSSELLSTADPFPGTRYTRSAVKAAGTADGITVTLPPLGIASFTVR